MIDHASAAASDAAAREGAGASEGAAREGAAREGAAAAAHGAASGAGPRPPFAPEPVPTRPFAAQPLPSGVQVPHWLAGAVAGSAMAGVALGLLTGPGDSPRRLARAVFFGAGLTYLTTSLADFAEHLRLEREATGSLLGGTVVPRGETVNHGLTIALVTAAIALVRRPPRRPRVRDYFSIAAPLLYVALGWRDELRFHRRRSTHREDLLHTVSHLAATGMLVGLYTARLWPGR